jgi:hypothetical protein
LNVRTTETIAGYYVDTAGHRAPISVPAGSHGVAGPEGRGEYANTRTLIIDDDTRDVILPSVRPDQYEIL